MVMKITESQLDSLREFMGDPNISDEWFLRHTDVKFDDRTTSIVIEIDNINEQEYECLKGLE